MNVFRYLGMIAGLSTIWLSLVICGSGSAVAGPNYHGRVSKARAGELVVVIGTEEFTFIVPASARIRVEGRPGSLEAIRKGATAIVVADRFGDVRIARRIDARGLARPKSPPLAEPSPDRKGNARSVAKPAKPADAADELIERIDP